MTRASFAVLIVSLFAIPVNGIAQTHPGFDGRSLQMGVDSMQIILMRDSLRENIGTLSNELSVKGTTLVRVYRSNNALFGAHVDTLVSDWPSLRARSQRTTSSVISVVADYAAGRVTGRRTLATGDTVAIANLQTAPPYDAAMFDVLVRATDFSKDSVVSVQAFSAGNDTVLTLSARLTGTERVTIGAATYDAWKVEMDFAGMSSTMWIEPKSRRLLKQIIRFQPTIQMMMVVF